jgi:hypothetical protein
MADVYDPDRIPNHSVKDFVTVAQQRHDPNIGSLSDASPTLWQLCDVRYDFANTRPDSRGNARVVRFR